ncbi:uncharacterized protein LOC144440717 [Glandiceps talaboti]
MSSHKVIFSIGALDVGNDVEVVSDLRKMCDELQKANCRLQVVAKNKDRISAVIDKKLLLAGKFQVLTYGRELYEFISEYSTGPETMAIVGVEQKDLEVAANTKSFLLAAKWVHCDDKVAKYGIPAYSPSKLTAILKNVNEQKDWFYRCDLAGPIPTTVFGLSSANHYGGTWHSNDEGSATHEVRKVLKDGDGDSAMKIALKCQLLAIMHHTPEFKEVQDWIVAPSSSSKKLSDGLVELKEHLRSLTNGGKREPVLVRGREVTPSTTCNQDDRQRTEFIQRHFETIHVNPHCTIKGRLDGRVVCVIDDYLNYGNTFETLRSLLIACGVQKIFLVALAKFRNVKEIEHRHENYRMIDNIYTPGGFEIEYKQQNYKIDGDIYSCGGYRAIHISNTLIEARFQESAKRDKNDLKRLARYLK